MIFMPFIKINGVKLHYIDQGKGKVLLFLHSWMGSSESFFDQIGKLSKKYRIIALDIRGHGRSSKTKKYGPEVFSKDLFMFINKMGLKNITLIGSSLGGNIAAHYAINYRDNIDSMILINTSAKYLSDKGYDAGHSIRLVATMLSHLVIFGRKKLIRRAVDNLCSKQTSVEDRRFISKIAHKIPLRLALKIGFGMISFDVRKDVSKINVPTLIIYGIDDNLCNFYSARFLRDNISNSKLIVFENSGHYPFIEERDRFNKEIVKFIN